VSWGSGVKPCCPVFKERMKRVMRHVKQAGVAEAMVFLSMVFTPYVHALELDPSSWVPGFSLSETPKVEEAGETIARLKEVGMGFFALAIITCIIFFLIAITKLGAAGDDARARKMALQQIMASSVAIMILGGLTTVLAFVWGFLHF